MTPAKPTRGRPVAAPLRVLDALAAGPATRSELAALTGTQVQTVGEHLQALKREGHVRDIGPSPEPGSRGIGPRPRVWQATGTRPAPPAPPAPKPPRARKPRPKKPKPAPQPKPRPVLVVAPRAPTEEERLDARLRTEILTTLRLGPATHRDLVQQLYRDRHDTLRRLHRLEREGQITKGRDGRYHPADHDQAAAA